MIEEIHAILPQPTVSCTQVPQPITTFFLPPTYSVPGSRSSFQNNSLLSDLGI